MSANEPSSLYCNFVFYILHILIIFIHLFCIMVAIITNKQLFFYTLKSYTWLDEDDANNFVILFLSCCVYSLVQRTSSAIKKLRYLSWTRTLRPLVCACACVEYPGLHAATSRPQAMESIGETAGISLISARARSCRTCCQVFQVLLHGLAGPIVKFC